MANDTLIKEAKDLPEDLIEQAIEFIRFLKYTSDKRQDRHSTGNGVAFHRAVSPLADEFISIANDFDESVSS